MKVLVTGASGLLGRQVYSTLKKNTQFECYGWAYTRAQEPLIKVDLTNEAEVKEQLGKIKPEIIIHCAAERDPDACEKEPEKTQLINITALNHLCACQQEHQSYFIFISTDYVFDGTAPPYRPEDQPRPLNGYGHSKLAGEELIKKLNNTLIIRIPVLYGPSNDVNESSVTKSIKGLFDTKPQKADHWAIRFPTNTQDIAKGILGYCHLAKDKKMITGIRHISNPTPYTKYQMIQLASRLLNIPKDQISSNHLPDQGASRPKNCQLDTSQTNAEVEIKYTSLEEGLRPLLNKLYQE